MKRKLSELTDWKTYEAKLLRDPSFQKEATEVEQEYQLARSIIELRLKQKLSQAELARKIGSKQPVISRLETGTTKPSFSLLERVAHALDAKLEVQMTKL